MLLPHSCKNITLKCVFLIRKLVLFLLLLSTVSCTLLNDDFKTKPLIVEFSKLEFESLINNELNLVLQLDITNPNHQLILPVSIDFEVWGNGILTANIKKFSVGFIQYNSTKTINIPIVIRGNNLILLSSSISSNKGISYIITGSFSILGSKQPFQFNGHINVPRIKLIDLSFNDAKLDKIILNAKIEVSNINNSIIPIQGIDIILFVYNNELLKQTTLINPSLINDNETREYDITISINNRQWENILKELIHHRGNLHYSLKIKNKSYLLNDLYSTEKVIKIPMDFIHKFN